MVPVWQSLLCRKSRTEGGKQVQVDPMTEEHDHPHYHGVDKAEENVSVSGEADCS